MVIWLLTFETVIVVMAALGFWYSVFARARSYAIYLTLGSVMWLCAAAMAAGALVFSCVMLRSGSENAYFPQALLLAVMIILPGLYWLILGALDQDGELRAAQWRTGRLAVAWIALGFIYFSTVRVVDRQVSAFSRQARLDVDAQYAAAIGPWPDDAENAATLYESSIAQLQQICKQYDIEQDKLWAVHRTADAPHPAKAMELLFDMPDSIEPARLVDRLEPVRTQLLLGSRKKYCRFPVGAAERHISLLSSTHEDHLGGLRKLQLLLRAHAILAFRAHRLATAYDDVHAMRSLAQQADQSERTLIGAIVRIGLQGLTDKTLIDFLPEIGPGDAFPADLTASEEIERAALQRDLQGEQARIDGTFLDIADGRMDPSQLDASAKVGMFYRLLWLKPDVAKVKQSIDRDRGIIAAGAYPHKLAEVKPGSVLLLILMPATNRICVAATSQFASGRQTAIAIALTRYRLATGNYPAKLDTLVPKYLDAIPADPFDGKPMRYRLDAAGATIYSVGESRIDHGGQIDEGRRKDVGYRLPLGPATMPTTKPAR